MIGKIAKHDAKTASLQYYSPETNKKHFYANKFLRKQIFTQTQSLRKLNIPQYIYATYQWSVFAANIVYCKKDNNSCMAYKSITKTDDNNVLT